MFRRPHALFAVLAGSALVVGSMALFPPAGENECVKEVDRIERGEVPEPADVLRYAVLPDNGSPQ